jgi:hypothetical protein
VGRVTPGCGAARMAVIAAVAVAVLAAGCGSTAPSPSPATSSPPTATPSVTFETGTGVARADQSLLAFTPVGSTGLTLTYDAETTATEIADPSLDPNVAALATGIASSSAPSASAAGDLVIVNVIRLRDASVDETWFRGGRDSYDQAACQPAGGVTGHAEAKIGGHDVFIGTCAGGAFTYHLRLSGGSVIVSLTSIGFARLGERIVGAMPTS